MGLVDLDASLSMACTPAACRAAGSAAGVLALLDAVATAAVLAVSVATGRFPIKTPTFLILAFGPYQIFEFLLF